MTKKRFHYLIADRDSICMGDDLLGHMRKWKVSGDETIADAVSILLTKHLPCNPPDRTETWLILCREVELAVVQQNLKNPIYLVNANEKVSNYFDDRGDLPIYSKCLWDKEREKFFKTLQEKGLNFKL